MAEESRTAPGFPPIARADALDATFARLDEKVSGLQNAFAAERTASKEAITAAFAAADKATTAALTAQKEAAAKAEEAATKQLEMHNGLIRKMDTLVTNFPTKESVIKDFETRDQRISVVDRKVAQAYGAAFGIGGFASVISAVAIFMAGKAS